MMSNEVEELRVELAELKERVTELETRLNGQTESEAAGGIRDFVESFNPSSHTERSLCIGYYFESYRGKESFTVEDIEEGYRECRVQPATNMSDVLGRMEDRNWLLRDGKDGQTQLWRLTANALETVERGVDNGA
jgi:hypothetical protein